MPRLNIERQNTLEPKRMDHAKNKIEALGYEVTQIGETKLQFEFMNHTVVFFPYSGWHAGSTIKDGRGLNRLLKQLKS